MLIFIYSLQLEYFVIGIQQKASFHTAHTVLQRKKIFNFGLHNNIYKRPPENTIPLRNAHHHMSS